MAGFGLKVIFPALWVLIYSVFWIRPNVPTHSTLIVQSFKLKSGRGRAPKIERQQFIIRRDSLVESLFMSPASPVFHTEVTVSIGLKTNLRVKTSIP